MKKLLFLTLLTPLIGHSLEFNVSNVNCGSVPGTPTSGQCGDLVNEIRNFEDLPDVSIDKYADGVSEANAFALKGQGSDYAEAFSYFMLKPSFGVAIKGDVDKLSDDPESAEGIGLGGALTIGLNMDMLPIDKIGPVDFSKLDLFVSFLSYNLDQDGDETELQGDLKSFGIYGRYRLIDAVDIVPGYMLEWGGLHLHTGIQRASMNLDVTQKLENQTVDTGSASADFTNGFAAFTLETETTSIPVEISTYMRMAYIFTLYGGAAFDYTLGSSDIDFGADGSLTNSSTSFSADVAAGESADGSPEATNFRAFGGVQFNIPFVRVFAQVNKGLGSDLVGATAGVKLAW